METVMEKINTTDPEFVAWLEACQKMIDEQLRVTYPTLYAGKDRTKFLSAEPGEKFIRIVAEDSQRSCWAFVVREDNTTKALGNVKRGDIHHPATWKAPAKHARGNIFTGGTGGVTQWTGPSYIRR
jgi:hypothetical protein